ncbi:MAG: hypothetical protein GY703_09580 [Gammaproteobacteria bacterium]|nr:hypothetical protein [Gammaproteobacteria bacterium]
MLLYRVLNFGKPAGGVIYQRHWVEPGYPVAVGPECLMSIYRDRRDDELELIIRLDQADGNSLESPLPAGYELDARPWTSMLIKPRCIESCEERLLRVLIDFVQVDSQQPLTVEVL